MLFDRKQIFSSFTIDDSGDEDKDDDDDGGDGDEDDDDDGGDEDEDNDDDCCRDGVDDVNVEADAFGL